MHVIVCGPQGSGKTTFGAALSRHLKVPFRDTSETLVEIATQLFNEIGNLGLLISLYDNNGNDLFIWDFQRGRPCRSFLVALGNALTKSDSSFLIDRCFKTASICCGVRRKTELDAAKSKYKDLIVIYCNRKGGSEVDDDNFDITTDDATLVVAPENLASVETIAYESSQFIRKVNLANNEIIPE